MRTLSKIELYRMVRYLDGVASERCILCFCAIWLVVSVRKTSEIVMMYMYIASFTYVHMLVLVVCMICVYVHVVKQVFALYVDRQSVSSIINQTHCSTIASCSSAFWFCSELRAIATARESNGREEADGGRASWWRRSRMMILIL